MQRVGNLFPAFCSFANLWLAWRKTKRGSGRTREGAVFFQNLEKELLALRDELAAGVWQPQPFRYFEVFDPKQRTIAVSTFRDRVVHHALVNVLEPIYEKIFIQDSYATRQGKGVHAAVFKAQYYLTKHDFFLKTDVEKFFDSVDHNILLEILHRKIKDKPFLEVCEKIIRHGGEVPTGAGPGAGLPIGNRTSQFFANVYLDPLDHFIKEKLLIKGYVRYMDDFVIFENDRRALKDHQQTVAFFLHEQLRLSLKPSATFLNRPQNGLPFLGRNIYRGCIRLRAENLRRITQRIKMREQQLQAGDIHEALFLHSMNSYWAMLSFYPELTPLRRGLLSM